jgi:K+-sensing histidine kinase KdpD
MLHSLVENAFFYSPDNGQIRISVARDEGLAKITIEDDAANSCERSIDLFDHDVAPALDSSGSLLGDVVAQKLAKAHGGTLTRTSSASGGSLVVLCLPLTHADAPSIDYIATAGLDPDFP